MATDPGAHDAVGSFMDDADDELTRLAIRQAFEATDQYDRRDRAHRRRCSRRATLVITESTPLRDQAMLARRQRKIRDALREI